MIKRIILFTAYQACKGKNLFGEQYERAIRLISALLMIHLLQIIFLVKKNLSDKLKDLNAIQYILIIAVIVLFFYLVEFVFSKKVLTSALSIFKESTIEHYSKLIAFGYFVLNLTGLVLIAFFNK
jgi:hypothetical protein